MAAGIGRRQFLSALGGAAATWPLAARGQQGGTSARVGFLYPGVAAVSITRITALREGLRAIGYGNVEQVEFLVRASEGDPTKLAALAADLVERKVDAIVAVSPSAVRTIKSATTAIPIIADDLESDPVASGFVASLAHPGGNITGVFSDFPEFGMKWLELLKEAIPALSSVAVLWDPATGPTQLEAVKRAGGLLGVKLEVVEIRAITELQRAFETAGAGRPDAIVILSSPIFGTNPGLIAELTLSHRIPTATLFSEIARAGSLMSYGPNLLGTFQQAGTMVGKILQGAQPADLPVQRPTKFETVINLKTARALGLNLPTSILLRADEVIE
jgi:putative tryptophan/tyrosine transport system substrate-binding protein